MTRLLGLAGALACAGLMGASAQAQLVTPGAPGEAPRALSAEESVAMSRTGYTEADVRFMQHMIVHHNQAVEMGALIEARTEHRGVRLIGERIALSQSSEMDMMRGWLTARREPVEAADLHAGHAHHGNGMHQTDSGAHEDHAMHEGHSSHGAHAMHGGHAMHAGHPAGPDAGGAQSADPDDIPLMPGMLSRNQMRALAAAEDVAFDRLFLEGMIVHHQGAIDMVDALMTDPGSGQDPQLSEFLGHVVADQTAEILRMQSMLSEL